ncbi:MAG: TlpA family protein disulfide reductase [Spirochaetales bacterium]|nr:TlpA family protein disulfide reductase [Spirochaetales bacterium]
MIKKIFLYLLFFTGSMLYAQQGMSPLQTELYNLGFGVPQKPLASEDFTLDNLSGQEVSLSGLRGKVVFLNFWATWCGPCRSEMPSMEKLYTNFKGKPFEMLAVASLLGDTKESINNYIAGGDYSFPVLLDPDGSVGNIYGVQGIPTTYIIGKDGQIIARLVGAYNWSNKQVVDLLASLVNSP